VGILSGIKEKRKNFKEQNLNGRPGVLNSIAQVAQDGH